MLMLCWNMKKRLRRPQEAEGGRQARPSGPVKPRLQSPGRGLGLKQSAELRFYWAFLASELLFTWILCCSNSSLENGTLLTHSSVFELPFWRL